MVRAILIALCVVGSSVAQDMVPILETETLARGQTAITTFELQGLQDERQPVLFLKARLEFESVAGYSPSLQIEVNDELVLGSRLLNRPLRVQSRSGSVYSTAAGERFSVYYSPDFDSPTTDPHYGLVGDYQPGYFEIDLNGLLREGENTLTIRNAADVPQPLIVNDARIDWREPEEAAASAASTDGPLTTYAPKTPGAVAFKAVEEGSDTVRVAVEGQTFNVESRFSTPDGVWREGSSDFFDHERRVQVLDELVVVIDVLHNKTQADLPVMIHHTVTPSQDLEGLWLAGLQQPDLAGTEIQPANPTVFGAVGGAGLGLMAVDDVFRIHARTEGSAKAFSLQDNYLVIPPGKKHEAAFAIIPSDTPSYWPFINAARRYLKANFTIPGAFAFLRGGPLTEAWSDEQFEQFIRLKDAYYTCATIAYPMYKGRYSHGTAFQEVDRTAYIDTIARRERLVPESKSLIYFHCFLDVTDEAPQRFDDARHLSADGTQADYGEEHQRLFVPLAENEYGPAVRKNVELIFDEIKADGVYWDEHEYSRYLYHYGEPWDGVSGDIDPDTHKLTRKKSSVTLITEQWRLDLAKDILDRGPLVGNGPPFTKAMAALQFPCFVETGSISNCTQAHLYSPIALGDHLTERSEEDAYRTMVAALDYGCVYHWYNDMSVMPTRHTLVEYMYPLTPVELHEGVLIAEERILTNRSGRFGWKDDSVHEVHVYNEKGREEQNFPAPTVDIDGSNFTELRLPAGYTAAIVRR